MASILVQSLAWITVSPLPPPRFMHMQLSWVLKHSSPQLIAFSVLWAFAQAVPSLWNTFPLTFLPLCIYLWLADASQLSRLTLPRFTTNGMVPTHVGQADKACD